MQVQETDVHKSQYSSELSVAALLSPEFSPSAMQQASATQESDLVVKTQNAETNSSSGYTFGVTEILTPEIIKRGGLEAAFLLLMQGRGEMFQSTLQSRINDSKAGQDRLLDQTKERLDEMRNAIKEMDKAKKFGKISETFGWVGLAASGVAVALTAGAASPLFLAASVGTFAVSTALQVDSATGGHMLKGIAGDSQKSQMAVSLAISGALLIASFGMSAIAASGNLGRAAGAAGKAGKLAGGGTAGNASGQTASSTSQLLTNSADDAAGLAQTGRAAGQATGQSAARSSSVLGGADDATAAAQVAGKSQKNPILSNIFGVKDPVKLQSLNTTLNNGDHWTQKGAQAVNSSLQVATSVSSVRGAHARFHATKLSAASMEMRAIEKRLSTYMDFIGQVVEDILAQLSAGNRTLAKQLSLAFDPKQAILSNI